MTYDETRYYKIDDSDSTGASNQGYDELVALNTKFNIVVNGDDNVTPFVNTALYDYFNVEYFKDNFDSNIIINVPNFDSTNIDSTNDSYYTNFLSMTQSNHPGYFNAIQAYANEYKLDQHLVTLAKKVTNYFIISTALYALLHTDQLTHDFSLNLNTPSTPISLSGSTQTIQFIPIADIDHSNLIAYLYYLYNHSIEDLKLNKPDSNNIDTYANHLSLNTTLNNIYESQFTKLSEKQNNFDTKKAFVITMMAKAHKANKLYSRKKFWFTIYISLLMLYIFGVVGVLYGASSSYEMFNMFQSSMIGFVMIILNSIILTILLFYEISKYFYK